MEIDDLIIKKAAEGDEHSFRIIVEKYQQLVFMICFNVVKDKQHAENIAQDTFLQVYKSLPQYNFQGFKTWLSRIALNKAIDYGRKINNAKKRELELNDEVASVVSTDAASLEEAFGLKHERKRVMEICNELPDIYRKVIHKYYFNEKAYSQIAIEEGVSIRTVESRLYRAKKLLKERWEEEENEAF